MEKVVELESNNRSTGSVDDPFVKEILDTFKQDSKRAARDILHGVWAHAAVAIVAMILAIGSAVRVLGYASLQPGFPRPPVFFVAFDASLTIVLFILAFYTLRSYLVLRTRYSRLSHLAEKT